MQIHCRTKMKKPPGKIKFDMMKYNGNYGILVLLSYLNLWISVLSILLSLSVVVCVSSNDGHNGHHFIVDELYEEPFSKIELPDLIFPAPSSSHHHRYRPSRSHRLSSSRKSSSPSLSYQPSYIPVPESGTGSYDNLSNNDGMVVDPPSLSTIPEENNHQHPTDFIGNLFNNNNENNTDLSMGVVDGNNNNNNDIITGEDDIGSASSSSSSSMDITYDDRLCPRDREEAKARGQSCLRKCNSHKDCISSKRRCLCDGLCGWSCIRPDLNCEELPGIANSRYILTNGNFFHSKLLYECDPGYIMSGTGRERICQGDGSWSGWPPQCKTRPVCGTPPFIPHSKHSELIGTEFELNKTVIYECFNGYEPHGSTEAVCVHRNNTVYWHIDLICVRKNCGDPGHIENGYRKISGYVFTSSVNYFCNEGYILAGRALRYCQSDGHWGGELPICKPVKCSQPEDPQNGRAFYDNYTYGSMVKYQCKTNFKLHGPQNRTCQANREWSGEEPECKIIDCGQPDPFPNGYVEIQSTTIGSVIYFYCFDGMVFDGQYTNSTCSQNGTWTPYPFPRCFAPCTVPTIVNGHVDNYPPHTKVVHGQPINVTCIENYDLLYESSSIVCYNGTWSQFPTCVPARCKKLPPRPRNGFVVAPKTDHGMRALFICHDGFELEGPNITFCHFGVWNISSPTCNPIYCPFPGYLENGKIMLVGHMGMYDYRPYIKRVTNGRQIIYECDRGYHVVDGPPGATCVDGQWSPSNLPHCELYSHPKLLRWNRSVRTWMRFKEDQLEDHSDDNNQMIIPSYEQSRMDMITTTTTITSPTSRRSSSLKFLPSTNRRKRHHSKPSCLRLPEKMWMKISIVRLGNGNDTYPHGTRIRLICDDGYVLTNPNRTLIKCAKGRWKPELPDCVPAPCITPTVPNARFHLHRRLLTPGELVKHEHRIEFICDEGYHQSSPNTNLTLLCSYGSWDSFASSSQVCVPKPCRLVARRLTNGFYLDPAFESEEITSATIEHDSLVPFECLQGFRPNRTGVEYRCLFGRIDPEPPYCVPENPIIIKNETGRPIPMDLQKQTDTKPAIMNEMKRCRSPEKIENALFYFDQLLSQHLTLIGVAQVDNTYQQSQQRIYAENQTINNNLDYRYIQHSSMPFEYEHGTEIVFRCVTYAQTKMEKDFDSMNKELNNNQTAPMRSTWIIRCENGNWIGRSFECDKDFAELEPEEKEELLIKEASSSLESILRANVPATNPGGNRLPIMETIQEIFANSVSRITPIETNIHKENSSCIVFTNDTNIRLYIDEQLLQNNTFVPHGSIVVISCSDIGKYQLIGPKSRQCQNGHWTNDQKSSWCQGLSQEYDYSLEKAPTILFRNQLGPIGQSAQGQLIVYPGTILHLDCLWPRKYGTPQWSWKMAKRQYLQYWKTDSSLEYSLTIFHAQEIDSGIFTCQTPNLHIHSVEIKVRAIHCPDVVGNLTLVTTLPSTTTITPGNNSTSDLNEMNATASSGPLFDMNQNAQILHVAEISGGDPPNRMGSSVRFECSLGIRMIGSDTIHCLPSGQWSDDVPSCNVTECYDLTSNLTEIVRQLNQSLNGNSLSARLAPAQIVEMNRSVGSKVIFTCPRGYGLQGTNHELECLITGLWSGSIPYCQEVRCGEPMIPKNGYIEGISLDQLNAIYYAGDIVQYACDDGYMIDGNPISICQENGRWSGPITKCKPSCNYPGLMHGSRLISEVKFFYEVNETINFECFEGTRLKGNRAIKCIASGRWSGAIPECVPINDNINHNIGPNIIDEDGIIAYQQQQPVVP